MTLLLAENKAFGHAIPGIIEPTLEEYTHLGDAASKTDGHIYTEKLQELETDGVLSGVPDDRWAFTTHITALSYDVASALAAASRVLRGYDDKLANECLETAMHIWDTEHKQPPALFHSFNTTGGEPPDEETKATVELLISTNGAAPYRARLKDLLPTIQERFGALGWIAVRAIPLMDPEFKVALAGSTKTYKSKLDTELAKNPYGVPIALGTWGDQGLLRDLQSTITSCTPPFPTSSGQNIRCGGSTTYSARTPFQTFRMFRGWAPNRNSSAMATNVPITRLFPEA